MAGDWIKMRSDLFKHPKVVRIKSALKADALRTVGGLMSVWCLFDAHSVDGTLEGYTPEVIDEELRWEGFAGAMIDVGWLVQTAKGLALPEFETHNGASAKRRAQDADRKREDRKIPKTSAEEADRKRTREEKRREEKNKDQNPLVDGKPSTPPCPHEQIIELYHEHCPTLASVKVWHETRRKHLQARWREDPKRQNLGYWERFFQYVAQSDFLTGNPGPWKADLEWLVNASNFVKVIEGKYHAEVAA